VLTIDAPHKIRPRLVLKRIARLTGIDDLGVDQTSLVRDGLASLLLKVLHAGLALAVTILLARILGPTEFGVYSFVFAFVTLVAIPIQFGLPILVVRETAAAQASADWNKISAVWFWARNLILIGSAIALLGGGLALYLTWNSIALFARWTFVWALPLVPLLALAGLHGAALRGFHRVLVGQLPDHVLRLGILIFLVGAWCLWPTRLTAPVAMGLHTLSALLTLIFAHFFLIQCHPKRQASEPVPAKIRNDWLTSILPLGFISAAQIINTRSDTILLGILANAEGVGLYQIAVQGSQFLALPLVGINLVLAPRLAHIYALGNMHEMQRLVTASSRVVVLLTLPIVLGTALFGGWLIKTVFGAEYQSAYLPLVILAIGQLINACFGSVALLLNMSGHERATACGLGLASTLNVALNLLLIPTLGIVGASIATAASLMVLNILLWHAVRQLIGINSLAIGRPPGLSVR